MPITPSLRNQAFESEHINAMSEAFVPACCRSRSGDAPAPRLDVCRRWRDQKISQSSILAFGAKATALWLIPIVTTQIPSPLIN